MKILTTWLRSFVPEISVSDHQLAEDLTLRGIAVEGIHPLASGHLFEMDITTNRVDAMNHYGIAREAATIYNLPLAPLAPTLTPHPTATPFPVRIETPTLCGRFTAQVLRNVTIGPSTGLIADYFTLLGQKQISNAVDASNFTLLGMGHPTHAFDLDKIEGGIVVRLAHKGERIKLLDGSDRILEPDDLVVADERKALALAGVMGGWDSMITPETKNILVEAAWFDPISIRRSSRRHLLHTDASHRFERGADINAAPIANALVSKLILESGGHAEGEMPTRGGYAEGSLIDIVIPEIAARTSNRPPIQLSVAQVQRHLGTTLDDTPDHSALTADLVRRYLTALGCTLTAIEPHATGRAATTTDTFSVQLPSWRLDLEREIDLIEEIARVYGYNRFANTLPTPGIVLDYPGAEKEAAVRTRLLALGYSEAISSTFAAQREADLFYTPVAADPSSTNSVTNSGTTAKYVTSKVSYATTAKESGAHAGASASGAKESDAHAGASASGAKESGAPYLSTASSSADVGSTEAPGIASSPKAGLPLHTSNTHPVPMENPLSEEASLLRPSLIPGMVTMLAHNLNRDVREVRLFEQGQIFTGTPAPDGDYIHEVHESPQLSLGLTGAFAPHHLYPAADVPFYELKGVLESILSLFTPPGGPAAISFTSDNLPAWLNPARAAAILVNAQPIAFFGELSATETQHRKLRQPVFLARLDLAHLYDLPLKKVTARELSRFQAVERDFSFVMPDTILWHHVTDAIHALAIPELQSLRPIEVWRDQKKHPGVHSLLVRCIFQPADRTLTDDELTTWSTAIIEALTKLGGTLRA